MLHKLTSSALSAPSSPVGPGACKGNQTANIRRRPTCEEGTPGAGACWLLPQVPLAWTSAGGGGQTPYARGAVAARNSQLQKLLGQLVCAEGHGHLGRLHHVQAEGQEGCRLSGGMRHMYIYVYICTHVHMYICTYVCAVCIQQAAAAGGSSGGLQGVRQAAAPTRTCLTSPSSTPARERRQRQRGVGARAHGAGGPGMQPAPHMHDVAARTIEEGGHALHPGNSHQRGSHMWVRVACRRAAAAAAAGAPQERQLAAAAGRSCRPGRLGGCPAPGAHATSGAIQAASHPPPAQATLTCHHSPPRHLQRIHCRGAHAARHRSKQQRSLRINVLAACTQAGRNAPSRRSGGGI